eukprot:3454460-Prymnesium_polylepis.1
MVTESAVAPARSSLSVTVSSLAPTGDTRGIVQTMPSVGAPGTMGNLTLPPEQMGAASLKGIVTL